MEAMFNAQNAGGRKKRNLIWIIVIVGVLLLGFVGYKMWKRNQVGKEMMAQQAAISTAVSIPNVGTNTAVAVQPAISAPITAQSEGVVISRSQCRNICKGKCGSRFGIGKRAKASRACWNECKAVNCGWEKGDL